MIIAAAYSEYKRLMSMPDTYGVKAIVGPQAVDCGVSVSRTIYDNLELLSKKLNKPIKELKVIVLWRERHYPLIRKIIKSGVWLEDTTGIAFTEANMVDEVHPEFFKYTRNKIENGSGRYQNGNLILIKDDDLTPTIDVVRGKADLLIGVGGDSGGIDLRDYYSMLRG